ncbi:MAG TPA: hypothetical protein VM755_14425 [Stellaceae bacterium]|nr:hypothetical protein [Stellaceae bacterium]
MVEFGALPSLLFLESNEHECREQDAEGLDPGVDLAESHADEGDRDGGGADQERHGGVPAVDFMHEAAF